MNIVIEEALIKLLPLSETTPASLQANTFLTQNSHPRKYPTTIKYYNARPMKETPARCVHETRMAVGYLCRAICASEPDVLVVRSVFLVSSNITLLRTYIVADHNFSSIKTSSTSAVASLPLIMAHMSVTQNKESYKWLETKYAED